MIAARFISHRVSDGKSGKMPIIAAFSSPSDMVLDPLCRCGTTIHVAQKLGRQWIGIHITHLTVNLTKPMVTEAEGAG